MTIVTLAERKRPIQRKDGVVVQHPTTEDPPFDPDHHNTQTNNKVHDFDPYNYSDKR